MDARKRSTLNTKETDVADDKHKKNHPFYMSTDGFFGHKIKEYNSTLVGNYYHKYGSVGTNILAVGQVIEMLDTNHYYCKQTNQVFYHKNNRFEYKVLNLDDLRKLTFFAGMNTSFEQIKKYEEIEDYRIERILQKSKELENE